MIDYATVEKLLQAFELAIRAGDPEECARQFLLWVEQVDAALEVTHMDRELDAWRQAKARLHFIADEPSFEIQAESMKAILLGIGGQLHEPESSDIELIKQIGLQRDLMIAVSTGGPRIDDVNPEYQERHRWIRSRLERLNIRDPNPYTDLWAWYGKWSSGDLPTYQSRRQYITELYATLLEQLHQGTSAPGLEITSEPTGWTKVDRQLSEVRVGLEQATTEEQFQAVGLHCRETLISLAQAVYDPSRHVPTDDMQPSETDAKRLLDAYLTAELAGGSNERARRMAKAAVDLANHLQHKRTATFRDAALCAQATASAVNLIAIISGQRDP